MRTILKISPDHLVEHLHSWSDSSARVTADSRQIRAGDIFFAYPTGHGSALRDGREFIDAALKNGAACVVFDPIDSSNRYARYIDHPQCVAVVNLAQLAGKFCSEWYGNPSQQLQMIGVTGTNGKTSITQWLAKALDLPSHRTAVLGTLGTGFPGALEKTGYTTPDAPKLQTQLKELLDAGAKQVAMEVSSHALEQDRIAGTVFNCAVFTNLTQDHLDYHGSMANYAQAKAKLFTLSGLQHAVINLDDAFGRELVMKLLAKDQLKVWVYALNQSAFQGFEKFGDRLQRVYAKDSSLSHSGYDSTFVLDGVGQATVSVPFLGEFNLSNALAVWAILLSQGFSIDQASDRIGQLQPVIGRMEHISLGKHAKTEGLIAVVDYAHTPDALQKALTALRPVAEQRGGKIWCVFGCGGDRDAGKRSLMGAIAEQFADQIVITSDNPRSEDPLKIIQMIREGIQGTASNVQEIPDRAAAIMTAIRNAKTQDIVLVAGKGHETIQEIGDKRFEFSDQEHIRLAAGGLL